MIEPTTRLFGLLMTDPREAWIARLYNYLFGANGLDAAYVTFLVRPDAVIRTLDGFAKGVTVERLHIAPGHWRAASEWVKGADADVDVIELRKDSVLASFIHVGLAQKLLPSTNPIAAWNDPGLWTTRASEEIEEAFGRRPQVPTDLDVALTERTFRPCKLTHDDFVVVHANAPSTAARSHTP